MLKMMKNLSGRNQCLICSRQLLSTEEFYFCTDCESTVHRTCWIEASERCPQCGSHIPADPFFWPVTPGLDITVAVTGGLTLILFLIAAVVLSQIPFGRNAPGTAGVAFYFVFFPIAAVALLLLAFFVLAWFLRRDARKPHRLNV